VACVGSTDEGVDIAFPLFVDLVTADDLFFRALETCGPEFV
jgi:hypothetical protein